VAPGRAGGSALREGVRVRQVQIHDATVEEAHAGQRSGAGGPRHSRESLTRGDWLATPGRFRPSHILDVRLTHLGSAAKPLGSAPVFAAIWARAILGRAVLFERDALPPGESCWAQLRLEAPATASPATGSSPGLSLARFAGPDRRRWRRRSERRRVGPDDDPGRRRMRSREPRAEAEPSTIRRGGARRARRERATRISLAPRCSEAGCGAERFGREPRCVSLTSRMWEAGSGPAWRGQSPRVGSRGECRGPPAPSAGPRGLSTVAS